MASRRLVLHVGLPKCASSALQVWADTNRTALRQQAIDYPSADTDTRMPKHQGLTRGLMQGKSEYLEQLLAQTGAPTLLLSTEGLSNHLYDFEAGNLAAFRACLSAFHVTVFLVVRPVQDWVRSYWKQAILNPPMARFSYATPLPLADFANVPRVRALCDTAQLAQDLAEQYGAADLVVADQDQWHPVLLKTLGVQDAAPLAPVTRVHGSIPDDLAELLRQVNAQGIEPDLRDLFHALVQRSFDTGHTMLMHLGQTLGPGLHPRRSELAEVIKAVVPAGRVQEELHQQLATTLEAIPVGRGTVKGCDQAKGKDTV